MTRPACGTQNPEQAKFCLECGASLIAPASQESRRTVTVVFADLIGFTSLGESIDQESLRRVMDRFYAEMRTAIEAHAGTLAKFIGDAVLAVWGTPEVREDDALRAVRAADAMRAALAGVNEDLEARWGVRVGMRTGVNTGEVVVDPSRPADLLVGDPLNVAARLEQAAADGEVLVGPETYRLVRDEMTLEAVAPLVLKGKAKPLPAWRVLDAHRPERRTAARLQAPLVGRSDELARLWDTFREVATARACRMTTVIGSPGLGKTRLVAEFARSISDQATVLHGRCQATGEGITFQPVAEVLRAAASIDDDDTPESAREKLGRVLPEDEPDRERIVERSAALLGLAPVASTEETFWAVRRLLEALARERPVILVHDDIHWGQPTFLDLLEYFVQWIRDAPVFVLALARPELREVRPALADPGAIAEVLHLEPLDAAASQAMVDGLLGAADLPAGLARRVLETTEGNPLFLGETLRMLADEGVLRREGDTWVAGDTAADVIVPPTINALLSARIQRLDNDERSVVERAAVIGHSFYRGAVAELAPPAVKPSVDGALVTLSRKELVRPEDEWWLDEQVFRFHHVLIRDAAYRSLLKEARAELHERFAGWLETKAGELAGEHEEVIAFHLEQAHSYRLELGPLDEAGRLLAARAAARLHSAGCRALAREDLPAAANLLRRALAPFTGDTAGRAEVLVDLAETLLSAGDTAKAEQVVEELGLASEDLGDERLRARTVVFATQLDNLTGAGHVRASADAAAQAAEMLAAADDRAGEAKAHQVVAQAEALLGQVAAAEAALDRALVAARMADDRRRITAVLSGAPRAALWGPAPIVRASGRCLDVVRILRMTPGNRHVEAAALRCQAVLEAMRGRAEAARGILDNCRMTLEELGLTLELHETAAYAGIVELLAGEPAAAEEHLRRAHEGFRSIGVEAPAAQAAALLARALLEQGRDDDALAATELAQAAGGEDLKTRSTWLAARAEVLSRRGEHDEALTLAHQGVELTEPTDALADKADALMALAAVARAAGDEAAARDAAVRARELYAAKDHTVGVSSAEAIAGAAPATPTEAAGRPPEVSGLPPAAAAVQRWAELMATKDWAGLRELFSASGFRLVERRTVGWLDDTAATETGAGVAVERMSTIGQDSHWRIELVAAEGDVAAARVISSGRGRRAGEWEVTAGLVAVCDGGRPMRFEYLDDDRDAILRRFEELRPKPETAAVRRRRAGLELARAGDWDGLIAQCDETFVNVDTRQLGWEVWDRHQLVENFRSLYGIGEHEMSERVLAADEALICVIFSVGGLSPEGARWDISLGIVEIGGDRSMYAEIWDAADEAAMLERFAELRPLAPTATSGRSPEISYARYTQAYNARDWEAVQALLVEDYTMRDGRSVGWEGIDGATAYVEFQRSAVDAFPDLAITVRRVLERSERACAVITSTVGHGPDGGNAELLVGVVNSLDADGRFLTEDFFDPDDEAGMLARFSELVGADTPAGRRRERVVELFRRHDFDAVERLTAPDYHLVDTRQLGWGEPWDRQAFMDNVRSVMGIDPDHVVDHRFLRTDDALFCDVIRFSGQTPEGALWDVSLGVVEIGRDLALYAEIWDPDDEAGMLARYEAVRALAPTANSGRCPEIAFARFTGAYNRRDWDGVRAIVREDFRFSDRRQVGWEPVHGCEAFVSFLQSTIETGADLVFTVERVLARDDRHILLVTNTVAHGEGGAEFHIPIGHVTSFDAEGRFASTEFWDPEDEAAMLARFGELTTPAARAAIPPLLRAANRAWAEAFAARHWERLGAFYAPDVILRDHRQGIRNEAHGREAVIATLTEAAPIHGRVLRWQPIAFPAENIVVVDHALGGDADESGAQWEMVLDQVIVYDSDLRVALVEIFDDRVALLARGAELADSPVPSWGERSRARFSAAFAARDWEAVRALFTGDCELDDRRRGIASQLGGIDEFLGSFLALAAQSDDATWEVSAIASAGEYVGLNETVLRGTDASGGAWEIRTLTVGESDEDGRTRRVVALDEDRLDEAYGLMDAWAAERALVLAPWLEPDATTELLDRWLRAFNARDLEGLQALYHPEMQTVDHRPGIRNTMSGADETMGVWRWLVDTVPDVRLEGLVLQAAGDVLHSRLAFHSRKAAYEISMEAVTLSPGGLAAATDLYELGDPAAAERFAELTGAGGPRSLRLAREWEAAFNARDWERGRAAQSPDYRSEERRPLSAAGGDGADGIAQAQAVVEVSPDARWTYEVLEAEGDVALLAFTVEGHSAEGAAYAAHNLQLLVADSHGTARIFGFADDQRAEAEAEYRAWAAHLRQARHQERVMSTGDVDRMRDELYAPGFTQVDHRRAGAPQVDAPGIVESMRDAFAMAPDMQVFCDVLAVRGDARAQRLTFRGHLEAGGGEVELVTYTLTRIDGLLNAGGALYETRDEAEAALAAAGDRPIAPDVAAVPQRWAACFNARDWDGVRTMVTDDVRVRDHRSVAMGDADDANDLMKIQLGLVDVAPDVQLEQRVLAAEALDGGCALIAGISRYHGGGDAPMEVEVGLVLCVRAGRTYLSESYDPDPEIVLARYDELRRHVLSTNAIEHAINEGDVDRVLRELVTEDFTQADFRPVTSAPHLDREGFGQGLRAGMDTAPDIRVRLDVLDADGNRRVARMRYGGHIAPGSGDFEVEFFTATVLRGDRMAHSDVYSSEAEARAAFAELRDPHDQHRRAVHAFAEAYNARDWDRMRRELFAPGMVMEDRRLASASGPLDAEAAIAALKASVDTVPDARMTAEILLVEGPVVGERVEYHGSVPGGGGTTLISMHSFSVIAGERIARSDIVETEEEMRAWVAHVAQAARFEEIIKAGDLDRLRDEILHPEFAQTDNRGSVHAPAINNREALLDTLRVMFAESLDLKGGLEVRAVDGPRRVGRLTYSGRSSHGGGEFEVVMWAVAEMRDGRLVRSDLYSTEEEARERLATCRVPEEIRAAQQRIERAFNDRDWDAYRRLLDDDFVGRDLRLHAMTENHGVEETIAFMQGITDVAPDVRAHTTFLVGEILPNGIWIAAGVQSVATELTEVSIGLVGAFRDGRGLRNDAFEPDEQVLLERYEALRAELHGSEADEPWARRLHDFVAAWNRRDWDAIRAMTAPDAVYEDRRHGVAVSTEGPEAFAEQGMALMEVAPDAASTIAIDAQVGDRLAVVTWTITGTMSGGPFELAPAFVVWGDDELRLTRTESFDTTDEALARLAELAGASNGGNLAARHFAERTEALNAREWERLETLYAEDCAYDDQRATMGHDLGGRDALVEMWRAASRNTDMTISHEIVSTDGERRAVCRYRVHGTYRGGPYEMVLTEALETDAEGRGWRALIGDDAPDDILVERLRTWHG